MGNDLQHKPQHAAPVPAHQAKTHEVEVGKLSEAHVAQLRKPRDQADAKSGKLFDEDLMLVARMLFELEPGLDKGADEVLRLRDEIQTEDATMKKDRAKIRQQQATNEEGSHDKAISRLINDWDIARNDRDGSQAQLTVELARWETTLTKAVAPARRQLADTVARMRSLGIDGQAAAQGLSYLANVLARYQDLCGRMGLDVGVVGEMQEEVHAIFTSQSVVAVHADVHDLAEMGDDDTVNGEQLHVALEAAQGQLAYANSLHDWEALLHPVNLLAEHLEEAWSQIHRVSPGARKKSMGAVNKIVAGLKQLHGKSVPATWLARLDGIGKQLHDEAARK